MNIYEISHYKANNDNEYVIKVGTFRQVVKNTRDKNTLGMVIRRVDQRDSHSIDFIRNVWITPNGKRTAWDVENNPDDWTERMTDALGLIIESETHNV